MTADFDALPADAARRVTDLGLEPHPEGGWYARVHTGNVPVTRPGGEQRPGITLIHYLLPGDTSSAWHRVDGDEIWHYLDGDPLTLWQLDERAAPSQQTLGPSPEHEPIVVVPAGAWQAARPNGGWTLAACAVGPGFSFDGFELLRERTDADLWLGSDARLRAML